MAVEQILYCFVRHIDGVGCALEISWGNISISRLGPKRPDSVIRRLFIRVWKGKSNNMTGIRPHLF
jgi:hypothetical protein